MSSRGDTTSAPAPATASRWEEPARAYAATLLEPPAAAGAVREALDVLSASTDRELGDDVVLTVVRDAVAKRVPRPAPVPATRRGLLRRSTPPRACSQMPELLAARAASRLSPADVERVAAHLDSCPVCDALESRVAGAERAFRRHVEQAGGMHIAVVPSDTARDVARPFEEADHRHVVEPEAAAAPAPQPAQGEASAWLPEPLRETPATDDIRASRGASAAEASFPASAWLIEPVEAPPGEATAPAPTSPTEWVVSDRHPATPTGAPAAPPVPSPRRRALRVAVPALLLALVAGGALAATGTFDTASDEPSSTQVDRTPPPPDANAPRSTAGSRTPLRSAAERRSAARRKAAARRRAAERRRAAARRRAATPAPAAPQSGTPAPTPAPTPTPAPVVRTPAPAPTRPTRPTPSPPSRPTQTTAQPPPSDAPKPSPPSSEPGRQPPPS